MRFVCTGNSDHPLVEVLSVAAVFLEARGHPLPLLMVEVLALAAQPRREAPREQGTPHLKLVTA